MTYRINANFAVSKAQEAVTNWTAAVANAKATNDVDGIRFCEASLTVCVENLGKVRKDVKENWTAYL